ncbi:GCN5-related protein N-acetyltransferase [Beutenbergia cavernae DSM 12333]|uniref:GCN5-related protein N-acetyltransferase n=1 Tax=Beutenbergia cavernae (strain ATCC BAA-8 / DSM 12333 / CCUG 43141 / JCM 11478 / NBRC 16432 / NCIMB 13614 / HKI 0122) TaxID=471853 RepID=C5BXA5_BEUC1|nr:GNAT family N-acetyltransferase [Beutenbergia cavernae]ACQ78780.1 GCN5-related protein N-acetyltransferase [Beutenbergia cavernae DSM 12333]
MDLFSPASRDDAISLILTHRPQPDTPGQRLLFEQPSLGRVFDNGQRAPERVWAVRGSDPGAHGLVAGRLLGDLALVDMIALPADDDAAALLAHAATSWARSAEEAVVSFESAAVTDTLDDPAVTRVVETFGAVGWQVRVTRRHYQLGAEVAAPHSAAVPLSMNLEQARPGDEQRLTDLLTRVLPGSLDVSDRELVAQHGLAAAAAQQVDDLLEDDPVECIRIATIAGADVGLISWRLMPRGRGYVLTVGVAVEHRGRGLAGELVAAATRDLVAAGAHTLIADTDDENVGMIRGFARAGWQPTEARIDLTLV